MICVNTILHLFFIILCQDAFEVKALMPLAPPELLPTGTFFDTNVTYILSYSCDPSSVMNELNLNSTDLFKVTCDGYDVQQNTWHFVGKFNGKDNLITIKTKDRFSYINGNMLAYSEGKIISEACHGDLVSWFSMASADEQAGCTTEFGVDSLTENYAYITIVGKCNSNCGNPGARLIYNPPVNNWGLVKRKV